MNRHQKRAVQATVRGSRKAWLPFERVDVDPSIVARYRERTGNFVQGWRNNVYAVPVFLRRQPSGEVVEHLAISRQDQTEVKGWSDLQRIKNEICGRERAALEVYPPDADVVDSANMRHLFVLPSGERAPFTIVGRWT